MRLTRCIDSSRGLTLSPIRCFIALLASAFQKSYSSSPAMIIVSVNASNGSIVAKRTLECEVMNNMREFVRVLLVPKVRHKLVEVTCIGLERATWRKVDVSNNLVNPNATRDVATLICLFLQLVCPAFVSALHSSNLRQYSIQGRFG